MKFPSTALLSLATTLSYWWSFGILVGSHGHGHGIIPPCEAFFPSLASSRGLRHDQHDHQHDQRHQHRRIQAFAIPSLQFQTLLTGTRLQGQALPNLEDLYNAPPEQLDQWVSQEYEKWCRQYAKTPDYKKRYPLFKQNCLMQWEHDLKAGQEFMGLNEYGDLAPEEYLIVESKIQQDYERWCREFGKTPSEERFEIYRQNVLINIEYYQKTGLFYHLNEFADLTEEEYQSVNASSDTFQEVPPADPPPGPVYNPTSPSGAGMASFADSLSGGDGQVKQDGGYMPKSYKHTTGTGMPSYFDALVSATPPATETSYAPEPAYSQPPVAPLQPAYEAPTATSNYESNSGPPSGAGMASFANSLSGGSGQMKQSSYMPKSYKQSSGSGMPSYFDSMSSGNGGGSNNPFTATPSAPEPAYPPPATTYEAHASSSPSYESGPPSGAGMASFANSLSGGSGQMKQSSYMPKSYKQTSGSGMPSYFDSMSSGSGTGDASGSDGAPEPAYQPPATSYEAPTTSSSYESGPPSGAGMASFANSLSGGSGQMKQSSYMPKSYKQSSGSGMASYFDSMPKSMESPNYPAAPPPAPPAPAPLQPVYQPPPPAVPRPAYQPPPVSQSAPQPAYQPPSPPPSAPAASFGGTCGTTQGAGTASFANSLSGGNGNVKQSGGFMPMSYKQSSGSGMPSYFDSMGSSGPAPASNTVPAGPGGGMSRKRMDSDQSAELLRNPSPPKNGPAQQPQGFGLRKPQPLKCDQTQIMREGEAFLPHTMDPVVKRGSLRPDQANDFQYFFTGRLGATEDFHKVPIRGFPSDQERSEIQSRRTLMYFQRGARLGRGPE